MTMEEQPQALEQSYGQFHRIRTQYWRTEEDRHEALETLKHQLISADRTLRLPTTRETAHARSKLILWSELARGTLKEMGQDVVATDA
jgi:hypothetical protein